VELILLNLNVAVRSTEVLAEFLLENFEAQVPGAMCWGYTVYTRTILHNSRQCRGLLSDGI